MNLAHQHSANQLAGDLTGILRVKFTRKQHGFTIPDFTDCISHHGCAGQRRDLYFLPRERLWLFWQVAFGLMVGSLGLIWQIGLNLRSIISDPPHTH